MSEEITKPKNKGGAPTIYSQELVDEICTRMANGETLRSICLRDDMPSLDTIWKWEQKYPEFAEQSARARERGTHTLADQCIEIADDPMLDPQDKRIRIDTRIRLIGKWNQKKYGDKIEVEANGNQNMTLSFSVPQRKASEIIELEDNKLLEG